MRDELESQLPRFIPALMLCDERIDGFWSVMLPLGRNEGLSNVDMAVPLAKRVSQVALG
jgi:hypothetical protein